MFTYFDGKETTQYESKEEFLATHDICEKLLPIDYLGGINIIVSVEDLPACVTVVKKAKNTSNVI
jgi:hypothetical protein